MNDKRLRLAIVQAIPNGTPEVWDNAYRWITGDCKRNETAEIMGYEIPIPNVEEVMPMRDVEKISIVNALKASNGNRKSAASMIGISERTMYRKCKQYNLLP